MTQRTLLLATVLLHMLASSTLAAVPSLTGNPQTLQDQQQDKVLKTALRQRNELPISKGTTRRLGETSARRKLSSKSKSYDKYKDSSYQKYPDSYQKYPDSYQKYPNSYQKYPTSYPPPPPPPGDYQAQPGGTGGYYPPLPQGGDQGYAPQYKDTAGGGYYPPPPTNPRPSNDDIPLLDDTMFDDAFYSPDNGCQLVTFNESFFFESAAIQLGVAGGTDLTQPGAQFLFAQNIVTPNGTRIEDTLLSGSCTRTSTTGLLGTSGAGVCQFNFVDVHGNYTVSAQGHLDTIASQVSAGNLVVTGGSGSMVSVVGEMKVVPVDQQGLFTTGDIFTGVYAYFVEAAFGVIICPALKGH